MARLKNRKNVGVKTVVEVTVERGIYMTLNGMVHHNCNHCVNNHLHPDGTPKVFKLSEVSMDYLSAEDRKNGKVSVAGQHNFCRCFFAIIMPGFGFKDGKLAWMGLGYDAYSEQNKS